MADDEQDFSINGLIDTQRYRQSHQLYLSYSQHLLPQREWMSGKFGPRIKEIFAKKKNIQVLGIGSGTGEADVDFLNEIVKYGSEVHAGEYSVIYHVVDVNPASLEYFKSVVVNNEHFSKVSFEWHVGSFDEFYDGHVVKENAKNSFDFIHFVRVFYYLDTPVVLGKTYSDLLAKDGIIAVLGEKADSYWPKFMLFLADNNINSGGFSGNGQVSDLYFLPGWVKVAEANNWKYEAYTQNYKFYVTPIFDADSKDGNVLLDFLFHGKGRWKTLEKTVFTRYLQWLGRNSKEEESISNDVKVIKKAFPCELGVIVITK